VLASAANAITQTNVAAITIKGMCCANIGASCRTTTHPTTHTAIRGCSNATTVPDLTAEADINLTGGLIYLLQCVR
jgi:hypothetical protein